MIRPLALLPIAAFFTVAVLVNAYGQDLTYAKSITGRLCSSRMQGRGYIRHGDSRAAILIKNEFQKIGLTPYSGNYYQRFHISVNTFPGVMRLEINGKTLVPGRDFIIDPTSPACKGIFDTYTIDVRKLIQHNEDPAIALAAGKVLILDFRSLNELNSNDKARLNNFRKKLIAENTIPFLAIIELTAEKLSYGISSLVSAKAYFKVNASVCPDSITEVAINIRNRFLDHYETQNVAGFIQGIAKPDSMLIFTAHYDHLGRMGKGTCFPGANDNAAGIAMLLALAEHFEANPPRYSIVFIAFSGEELGLLGSGYFTKNPLLNLSKIKFLINLDMVGQGSEGITVVNGSVYTESFNTLITINNSGMLLPVIKKRGEACNSDHCPFYSKGVPCFFIYTMGGSQAYHDIDDIPENLTYSGFPGLVKLLVAFTGSLN